MVNLKYTLNEMIKKPFIFILIILQIAIGTSLMIPGITQSFKVYNLYSDYKKSLSSKSLYKLKNNSDDFEYDSLNDESDKQNKQLKLYNDLKFMKNGTAVSYNTSNILVKNFTDDDKFYDVYVANDPNKYMTDPYENVQGKFSNLKGFYIDSSFIKEFPLKAVDGRAFDKNDFISSDTLPVMLGGDYKGIYKTGDKFDYFDSLALKEKKLKVIGILDKGKYINSGFDIETLDNKIICPVPDIISKDQCLTQFDFMLNGTYIVTDNKGKALEEVRNISSGLKSCSFDLTSLKNETERLFDDYKKDLKSSLLISITIFIFISIGIVTVQLNNIKDKQKEYGIHLLCGCSKKNIMLHSIYSTLLYLGIGMASGAYIEYSRIKCMPLATCDIEGFLSLIIIYILLTVIISYFPCRRIHRSEINNIIKGMSE